MAEVVVSIKNLNKLKQALEDYPKIAAPRLAKAINASLATIQKHATETDEYGGIFMFRTPRFLRTGWLAESFGIGIETAKANKLQGSIGPVAHYAIYVHEGRGSNKRPNPFMVRIVKDSEKEINDLFKQTLDLIVSDIANAAE
jgi:hypothetical protein